MRPLVKYFVISTSPFWVCLPAHAQVTDIHEGAPIFEVPATFGPVGTYFLIAVKNTVTSAPTQNIDVGYYEAYIETDDKVAKFPTKQQLGVYDPYALSGVVAGALVYANCLYEVTQEDVARGSINFTGIEDGHYKVHKGFGTLNYDKYIFDDSFSQTIVYDPAETGMQYPPIGSVNYNLSSCADPLEVNPEWGWSYKTGSGGYTEQKPLMPTTQGAGTFLFNLGLADVPSGSFWIDPPVAVGYTYSVTNAEFISVTAPSQQTVPDPDGYVLEFGPQSIPLQRGESHSFTNPVSSFELKGINPDLTLDPGDELAFPIGIDLTDPTDDVQITQTAHVENYSGSNATSGNNDSSYLQLYEASNYNYCDAKLLGLSWGKTPREGKIAIGRKIAGSSQQSIDPTIQAGRNAGGACQWGEISHSYADAVTLGQAWGVSTSQAKAKAAAYYTNGQSQIVLNALSGGNSSSGNNDSSYLQLYEASNYNYCDAKLLGFSWGKTPREGKIAIGRKIAGSSQQSIDPTIQAGRNAGGTCEWGEISHSYADAVTLSQAWGVSTSQAKAKAAAYYTNGQSQIVLNAL